MPDSIELTAATEPQKAGIRAALEALKKDAAEVVAELQDETLDPLQPERIGKERMPESLEVTSINLTDTGAVALPVGSLGLNNDGELVLHDNVRNGDDLPAFVDATAVQPILSNFLISSIRNTSLVIPLASIKFPASVAVNGKIISISGEMDLNINISVLPTELMFFGFRNRTNVLTGNAMLDDYSQLTIPGNGRHKLKFNFMCSCQTGNLFVFLGVGECNAELRTIPTTVGGAITSHTAIWKDSDDSAFLAHNLITLGQPIDLEFIFFAYDTGNLCEGSVNITGSIHCGHD